MMGKPNEKSEIQSLLSGFRVLRSLIHSAYISPDGMHLQYAQGQRDRRDATQNLGGLAESILRSN